MTRAAGVSDWLIDTGLDAADYLGMAGMADVSGGRTHEIVRLELVAESLIREIANPADYVEEFGQRLHELTRSAVGVQDGSRLPRRIRPGSQPARHRLRSLKQPAAGRRTRAPAPTRSSPT